MARTDNDTWDLASSVGATATMVAAARAIASKGPDAIIDDPFAEPLVRAVGVDFFTRLASGELSPAEIDQQAADQQGAQAGDQQGKQPGVQHFADTMAARTRFFDEFFADAGQAGIRQAVILAAGLDSRAYRLPWPDGTVVYEIDQPDVIEFKSRTMAELGATPTADRRTVPMDLRFDWPAALAEAGFDRTKRTAWIAEGLFGYLPPDAQDRLLDQITELSPAGSRIAVEGVPKTDLEDEEAVHQRMQDASDHWRAHGFDLDFSELVYLGDRADVTTYLEGHDWQTSAIPGNDLLVKYGLTPVDPDDSNAPFVQVLYISASK